MCDVEEVRMLIEAVSVVEHDLHHVGNGCAWDCFDIMLSEYLSPGHIDSPSELHLASLALVQQHLQSRPIETSTVAKAIKIGVCCWEAPSGGEGGRHSH